MMNISFALTTEQVRNRSKTVTRRIGWKTLKPGALLQPVLKAQGIPKGGTVTKVGGPIRVVSVRRERLDLITDAECVLEGFPTMRAAEFVEMFGRTHRVRGESPFAKHHTFTRPVRGTDTITRIEFEYV